MPGKLHTRFGDEANLTEPLSDTSKRKGSTVYTQRRGRSPGNVRTRGSKKHRDGSRNSMDNTNLQGEILSPTLGSYGHPTPQHDLLGEFTQEGMKASMQNANTTINNSDVKREASRRNSKNRRPLEGLNTFTNPRKEAQALGRLCKQLPIWSKRSEILQGLRHNDILLLNGETGSGKSTQVPQFLHEEPWCQQQTAQVEICPGSFGAVSIGGIIAITQPRRVAAINLAYRVAHEMGYSIKNGEAGKVGYSVRFDTATPRGMKIKFLTEGTLLQEMLHDPNLRKYSAVIVDEIHERSVDVDIIAGFLRRLLHSDKKGRGGVPLKVVVMSATLDLGRIEAFFAKPTTQSNYKCGGSHGKLLDRSLALANTQTCVERFSSSYPEGSAIRMLQSLSRIQNGRKPLVDQQPENSEHHRHFAKSDPPCPNIIVPNGEPTENGVAVVYVEGRQYEVKTFYEPTPCHDYLQNMLQTILGLHTKEPLPGDILAFLTGRDEIETLKNHLESISFAKEVPRMKIMSLHGSLSAQAQQGVFERVKDAFTRKVVLATNIAETSVTVSGVRFVVDCGKSKVKQYRPRLGLESLLAKPISRVSAIQRKGRAGREGTGKCFRMYTKDDYLKFEQDSVPEILRSDVTEAVLKIKARGIVDLMSFPLMDAPNPVAIEKALSKLHLMGALDDHGRLTAIGEKMVRFPLPASLSRVIVAASETGVALELIDAISCLTADSDIFLQSRSEEDAEHMERHRKDIQHREGDVMTLISTMRQYAAENADRTRWCRDRGISEKAIKMAMNIRKQLRRICLTEGLLQIEPPPDPQPASPMTTATSKAVLQAFLKAFILDTAFLAPDGIYLTVQGRNPIHVHPSSILFGRKPEAIMFLENTFTTRNYAKCVNIIEAGWIVDVL